MNKYVYLILCEASGNLKIGISKSPQIRIKKLQTSSGEKLRLIKSYKSEYYNYIEKSLHNRFSHIRKEGEWFEYDLNLVEYFETYCKTYEKTISLLKKNNNFFI